MNALIFLYFQDFLYNRDFRSGDLYQVLIYRQRKYAHCGSVPIPFNEIDVDQDEVDKLVNFLGCCKLPADEKKLKQKLEQTIDLHKMLIAQQDDTYPKISEFYLVDPQMVRVLLFIEIRGLIFLLSTDLFRFSTHVPTSGSNAIKKCLERY